jgi:hypothetical protein
MRKWWFISVWVTVMWLAGASGARAAAPADEEAAFRAHYDRAVSLYNREQYDEAIKEFQTAYVVKARPRLLFNIGQAQRILGNYKEALRFYLMYQALEPNPKPGLRAELERYIAQMSQLIGTAEGVASVENLDRKGTAPPRIEEKSKPAAPPPSGFSSGSDASSPSASPFRSPSPSPSPSLSPSPSPLVLSAPAAPVPGRKPFYRRGWFWGTVGGAAAAALVVGLAAGLTAGQNDRVIWRGW